MSESPALKTPSQFYRDRLADLLKVRTEALKYGPRDFVSAAVLKRLKKQELELERQIREAERKEKSKRPKAGALTKHQLSVHAWVTKYTALYGEGPKLEKIAEAFQISVSGVSNILAKLERHKLVKRSGCRSERLKVTDKEVRRARFEKATESRDRD